jgi:hypothetical protein
MATKSPLTLTAIGALLLTTQAAPAQTTPIEEVVMYGIDQGTNELLRYEFATDTFTRIGEVVDQNGKVVKDNEGLAFIPTGPNKGMYSTANYNGTKNTHLAKINPMDATATIMNMNDWDVVGLVAARNAFGEWTLLAVSKPEDNGEGEYALKQIDPATGTVTILMGTSRGYEGLAVGPDGTLYAAWHNKIYKIDPVAGTETSMGSTGFDDCEALEWAYGDYATGAITVAEAPGAWTDKGVLFAFSDYEDALYIINPQTAEGREYNCSFKALDCEGLVFTTQFRDSYGEIVVHACD